ncbi:MAG: phage tail sheath C-terminal domain-containing protein [Bacteroidia bacterium]
MALTLNTPGVYIEEVPTLPSSVVAVPTSIPVFIGYTAKANINGVPLGFPSPPTRITSMLDFQTIFGGAYEESFTVTLSGSDVEVSPALVYNSGKDFTLFYQMQMYFANGGGPCYIIAVDDYDGTITALDMQTSIELAEQIDEITLVVVPEAMSVNVTDADRKGIYDAMLAHCAVMKDRFAVLDVETRGTSIADDANKFRNLNVGANNLSYGAAYYPPFSATLSYYYTDAGVDIIALNPNLPANVQAFDGVTLDVVNNGNGVNAITTVNFTGLFTAPLPNNTFIIINGVSIDISGAVDISEVMSAINIDPSIGSLINLTNTLDDLTITAVNANYPMSVSVTVVSPGIPPPLEAIAPDKALYSRIQTALSAFPLTLYPSSTMVGIYAAVDNDRGVWKAPANVGVALVSSLNENVKNDEQGGLNVDPSSGKSINVIRRFDGRGILVWGARTLEGNSNEWRYISVRRLFLFIEDSCKHASEFVVFEPNDKNTWVRVKGMITNFLTSLWRDGALAGSKPEQAFYVRVGLGETMSAQDILEGKLIVQIGIAAVRPAEFIILQFEHKLQEA